MSEKLVALLALWPSIAILVWILVRRYRGGFMAIAYIVNMFIVYWFGAAAHALPWSPFMSSERTITGFEASTVALALFALGLFLVLSRTRPSTAKVTNVSRSLNYGRHLSTVLLRIGL